MFQVHHGMLFGLPNAVTSFNRWSRLAEALVRRLLAAFYSMYFDDATMQDWKSMEGSGQAQVPSSCIPTSKGLDQKQETNQGMRDGTHGVRTSVDSFLCR